MSEDLILDHTLACLRPHMHVEWGDREPLDVLGRLMAKHFRPAGWTQNTHLIIRRDQVRSRREQWGIARLGQLKRGHAAVAGPRTSLDGPIVVVEHEGVVRLLDGNHRINTWLGIRDSALHDVHIHTIEGTGGFVEVPGIG